jgi:hypothetical protein
VGLARQHHPRVPRSAGEGVPSVAIRCLNTVIAPPKPSRRKLDHGLTLGCPIYSKFGFLGSWFDPEVALNWLFP